MSNSFRRIPRDPAPGSKTKSWPEVVAMNQIRNSLPQNGAAALVLTLEALQTGEITVLEPGV
jgi:hypothetical protein